MPRDSLGGLILTMNRWASRDIPFSPTTSKGKTRYALKSTFDPRKEPAFQQRILTSGRWYRFPFLVQISNQP